MKTESEKLVAWAEGLTSAGLRAIDVPQSALLESGRRLRGVEVAPGLYLHRTRRFYATSPASPTVAIELTPAQVLEHCSLDEIKREYRAKRELRWTKMARETRSTNIN